MKELDGSLSKDYKLETTRTTNEGSFGGKQRNSTFTTTNIDDSSMRMNLKSTKKQTMGFDKSANNHLQKSSPKHGISNFQNIQSDAYNLQLDRYQLDDAIKN